MTTDALTYGSIIIFCIFFAGVIIGFALGRDIRERRLSILDMEPEIEDGPRSISRNRKTRRLKQAAI